MGCTQAQPWQQYAMPEEAGFSAEQLEAARQFADEAGSGAVVVIYKGHVLVAWGDVERNFRMHSVRKSLVSALYGIAVEDGTINLDMTLGELDITDREPLTPSEQQAQIRDLLASRSGVYLPAAYAPSDQDRNRPLRGQYAPGTYWFYNNWDFNVAGVIYEQLTETDLYTAFTEQIAGPLGMEDFDAANGFPVYEPSLSIHPAQTFRMSARDLARFGQLYLQNGTWNGERILPADWIQESTQPISDFGNGQGYGYMWWTAEAGSYEERFPGRFSHVSRYDLYMGRGSGGQGVVVIPEADLVFVHRGDTDNGNGIGGGIPLTILDRVLAAHEKAPVPNPTLQPLRAIPFASQQPAPETPTFIQLAPSVLATYVGDYELGNGAIAQAYIFKDRLFMNMPGQGEAELFALSESKFTVRVISGVHLAFEHNETGHVTAVDIQLGPRQFRAIKR